MSDDQDTRTAERDAGASDQPAWHALEAEEIVERLEIDPDRGLSADEASKRLDEHGPNEIGGDEGTPWWKTLLDQFRSPLISILIIAASVSATTSTPQRSQPCWCSTRRSASSRSDRPRIPSGD